MTITMDTFDFVAWLPGSHRHAPATAGAVDGWALASIARGQNGRARRDPDQLEDVDSTHAVAGGDEGAFRVDSQAGQRRRRNKSGEFGGRQHVPDPQ